MTNLPNTLQEEFRLLWRATRSKRSRFIVVQYNHYDLVRQVLQEIQEHYPKRPLHRFNLQTDLSEGLSNQLLQLEEGFISIEHFEDIFKPNNQKVAVTLNQRRDAFRLKDTVLLIFLPIGKSYLQKFSTFLPDFYSIVSPVIQLVKMIEYSFEYEGTAQTSEIYLYSNSREAREDIERINVRLGILEKIKENDRLRFGLNFDLGRAYSFIGNYQKAKEIFQNIYESAKNTLDEIGINYIRVMLGWMEKELGNYVRATELTEKAIEIGLQFYANDKPEIIKLQSNLGLIYRDTGKYNEATILLKNALISAEIVYGKNHLLVAFYQSNLATVYISLGYYIEAAELLENSLALTRTYFPITHPYVAMSKSALGTAYINVGRYTEAITLLESALESDMKNFGENHPKIATRQSNLASAYQNLGRHDEAIKLLKAALTLDLNNFGHAHFNIAIRYTNIGSVYIQKKEYEKAKFFFEKAFFIFLNNFGEEHPYTEKSRQSFTIAEFALSLQKKGIDFEDYIKTIEDQTKK